MAKNCFPHKYSPMLEAWEQEAYKGGYGADWLEEVGEGVREYASKQESCGKRPTFAGLMQYLKEKQEGVRA